MFVPGPVPATRTCCTQLSLVRFGEYEESQAPMMAITAKTARITSPVITLGERGRRSARDGAEAVGVGSLRIVVLIVIASRFLPSPRIDQHVDHIRKKVRSEHDKRDHHEDSLNQRVVQRAERAIEVIADPRVVEDNLDQNLP